MAAHKALEEKPVNGIRLVASAPASGGYDLKGMQEYFFGLETYSEPYYLAFVAVSYSITYDNPDFITDIFKDPYATLLPSLFDGTRSGGEINDSLTDVIADLIQSDILKNIDSDINYRYLVNAFKENSLNNWVPPIPVFMFHGSADITVPYQNSTTTYDNFLALGASKSIVTFTELEGANDGSGVLPYLIKMMEIFEPLSLDY